MEKEFDPSLPIRRTPTVWPEKLLNLMKSIDKVGFDKEIGKYVVLSTYEEGDKKGFEILEIIVEEEIATQNGGGI